MKKALLLGALVSLGAFSAFGATACSTATQTLTSLDSLGVCTITDLSGNSWNLSTWTVSAGNLSGVTPSTPVDKDRLNVTLTANTLGFTVTISPVTGLEYYFNATNPAGAAPAQTITFTTGFWVTANDTNSYISSVTTGLNGAYTTVADPTVEGPNAGLTKYIYSVDPTTLRFDASVGTSNLPSTATRTKLFDSSLYNPFAVSDVYSATSGDGEGNGAGTTGYYNTFVPASTVPEPMTFAMMGAGLVGLAVLRRRK